MRYKSAHAPIDPNTRLSKTNGEAIEDPSSYRRFVGKMLYLTITHPSLNYVVNKLSQYLSSLCDTHLKAIMKGLLYIKGFLGHGPFFSASSTLQLKVSVDVDWATCLNIRRLTIGFCVFLGDSLDS